MPTDFFYYKLAGNGSMNLSFCSIFKISSSVQRHSSSSNLITPSFKSCPIITSTFWLIFRLRDIFKEGIFSKYIFIFSSYFLPPFCKNSNKSAISWLERAFSKPSIIKEVPKERNDLISLLLTITFSPPIL